MSEDGIARYALISVGSGTREMPFRNAGFKFDLAKVVADHPTRSFAAFTLLHIAIWTLVPSLLIDNPPLDIIEGVSYGQEWQLAYWKHPPLPWWLDAAVRQLAGTKFWPFFLLGQLCVALCFWAIWRLGREFLRPVDALLAVVLLDGCVVFTVLSKEFNHNTVQLPIWALLAWVGYLALTRNRILHWVLIGVGTALAVYAKYSIAALIVPLLLFSLIDPCARRCWKSVGPYLAILICAMLIAPHVAARSLIDIDLVDYTLSRATEAAGLRKQLRGFANLAVNSALQIGLSVVLFAILQGSWWRRSAAATQTLQFARRYVAVIALGPFVLAFMIGLISGRDLRSGWVQQFWPFVGLFLVTIWSARTDRSSINKLAFAWIGVTMLLVASQIASQLFFVSAGSRTQFPGSDLAVSVTAAWRQATGEPLSYVIGDIWLCGNVIFFSNERPRMFLEGDRAKSPWIDAADLERKGAVLLWETNDATELAPPDYLRARYPAARANGSVLLRKATLAGERTWRVAWMIISPVKDALNAPPK